MVFTLKGIMYTVYNSVNIIRFRKKKVYIYIQQK